MASLGHSASRLSIALLVASCASTNPASPTPPAGAATDDSGAPAGNAAAGDDASPDGDAVADAAGVCTLTADTSPTSTVDVHGCALLTRDTDSCRAARQAQGLSGVWLELSCRVALTRTANAVEAKADGQPDYTSFYFPKADPCYAPWPAGSPNPNHIEARTFVIDFPLAPSTTPQAMPLGAVGMAIDGVPIFSNVAAPGDDIYLEAQSFDRCGGHPQMTGQYHFHTEPAAITQDDANLVGVLRDGYPVYGRKDPDGTYPGNLDAYGGHTSVTAESPTTPVYHYHANLQTSTAGASAGDQAWFLTTGAFRGTPGACAGCM